MVKCLSHVNSIYFEILLWTCTDNYVLLVWLFVLLINNLEADSDSLVFICNPYFYSNLNTFMIVWNHYHVRFLSHIEIENARGIMDILAEMLNAIDPGNRAVWFHHFGWFSFQFLL